MENQIQDLISQIQAIQSKSGKRSRFPPALKAAVVKVYRRSENRAKLRAQLGIGHSTLSLWLRLDAESRRSRKSAFKSMCVSEPKLSPRLCLASGVSVENLSEEFLFKVLTDALSKT